MDKKQILETIKQVRENSEKRKFSQSIDLVINLKQYDLKKNGMIDKFIVLPHTKGKQLKICGLVDKDMADIAKGAFAGVVPKDEFDSYKDNKKKIKKLVDSYDFFVAQANVMTNIAATFGRILGPKGKMPNPKAGCVVGPGADLKSLAEKLQKTVRLRAIKELSIKASIANESMKDEEIADNVLAIYNNIIHSLPAEAQNIRGVGIKVTMGPLVIIGEKFEKETPKEESKEETKKKVAKKKVAKKEVKEEPKKEAKKETPKEEKK